MRGVYREHLVTEIIIRVRLSGIYVPFHLLVLTDYAKRCFKFTDHCLNVKRKVNTLKS